DTSLATRPDARLRVPTHTEHRPTTPRLDPRACSNASSTCWRMCRAEARHTSPAGVSTMPFGTRSNSSTSISRSRSWICRVSAGCASRSRLAAAFIARRSGEHGAQARVVASSSESGVRLPDLFSVDVDPWKSLATTGDFWVSPANDGTSQVIAILAFGNTEPANRYLVVVTDTAQ